MRTDITRNTFDPAKNFRRVLLQQGRVLLDADWNEQVSILLHYLRTLTVDLIGQSAGPNSNCGFELVVSQARLNALVGASSDKTEVQDLFDHERALLGPGRYYVDGLLVENPRYVSLFHQPNFRRQGDLGELRSAITKGPYVVYLDAWEREVTSWEDDSIREKALDGPDTAARSQVVWRVRYRELTESENIDSSRSRCVAIKSGWQRWEHDQGANRGKLRAKVLDEEESDDPCVASAESAYRGVENQLYRVEIHHEGAAWDENGHHIPARTATFKWSRDNGSVFAPWLEQDGNRLTLAGLHDRARGFASGQWIELNDQLREISGKAGKLVKVSQVDGDVVTIEETSEPIEHKRFSGTAVARRWDQQETEETRLHKGAIPVVEGKWFTLEDGVQVYFEPSNPAVAENHYRTGDYWLIPARVATKGIEWPQEEGGNGGTEPAPRPPHGITHHYAPLGILSVSGDNLVFEDCRCRFDPLRCTYGYSFNEEGPGVDLL